MSVAAVAHYYYALPDTPYAMWVRGELADHGAADAPSRAGDEDYAVGEVERDWHEASPERPERQGRDELTGHRGVILCRLSTIVNRQNEQMTRQFAQLLSLALSKG